MPRKQDPGEGIRSQLFVPQCCHGCEHIRYQRGDRCYWLEALPCLHRLDCSRNGYHLLLLRRDRREDARGIELHLQCEEPSQEELGEDQSYCGRTRKSHERQWT